MQVVCLYGRSWSQVFLVWSVETGHEIYRVIAVREQRITQNGFFFFVKNVLKRVPPSTFISHTKMSIFFGTGRSTSNTGRILNEATLIVNIYFVTLSLLTPPPILLFVFIAFNKLTSKVRFDIVVLSSKGV